MSVRIPRLALVLALSVVASGCVPDPNAPQARTETLDAALAEIAHPALDYAVAAFSGAGVVSLPIVPARCQFDATTRGFVCAPLSGAGLTLNQTYTLIDASGGKQAAFDAGATSEVSVASRVSGVTVGTSTRPLTIDGQQTLDLTGLRTGRHTLNGSSSTHTTEPSSQGPTHPPLETTITTTITSLVIPATPADAWPLSGTIEIRTLLDAGETLPTGGTTSESVATLTFSGSSTVDLRITVNGNVVSACRTNIIANGLGCVRS
jgi:hypothetical protein